jgi:hypothetical protein
MQKPLENTSIAFNKPTGAFPFLGIGSGMAALMLIGGTVAGLSGNWLFALLFIIAAVGFAVISATARTKLRHVSAAANQNMIDWSTAIPELQRQSLNIEVRELSRILEVDPEQLHDLQSAYIVAEDLALRQIQQEEGVPLLRHVNVGGIPFDAIFVKDGALVCCEASFLVAPEVRKERVDAMLLKIGQANRAVSAAGSELSVRLMLLLVTQLVPADEAILRADLKKGRFTETPVDIDIRILDFETLQRMYVTD